MKSGGTKEPSHINETGDFVVRENVHSCWTNAHSRGLKFKKVFDYSLGVHLIYEQSAVDFIVYLSFHGS